MSLKDFMKQLQEEDTSVVFSKPPEESIQIIPPEKSVTKITTETIKVIPPEIEKPKVIKFKMKQPEKKEDTSPVIIIPPKKKPEPQIVKQEPKIVKQEPVIQKPVEKPKVEQRKQEDTVDLLFKRSDTPLEYKELWLECYNKAISSKKDNYVTKRMRLGRFTITEREEVILLSDYNTSSKTVSDILNDQWL